MKTVLIIAIVMAMIALLGLGLNYLVDTVVRRQLSYPIDRAIRRQRRSVRPGGSQGQE